MISEIERRMSRLGLPVALSLWDGSTINPKGTAKIHLTLKSPQAISSLVRPTLGKIAKAYVEGQIDIEGDVRETIQIGERLVSDHASTYQRRSAV
ncbi:MAG: hypothetical protein PVH05_15535, partial [Burkholderiales bacterium]